MSSVIPSCTIIVPCFNEASRLQPPAFLACLAATPDVGFLFVDDGSRDGTKDVIASLRASAGERIGVLVLERNQGKAEAVRLGVLHALEAGSSLVGYWDADLATPLDEIHRLTAELKRRSDVEMVMGSRVKMLGHDIRRRAIRHYLRRVFATAASLLLRLPVYDTQCGAKILRATPTVRAAFARPFETRWIFDVELLARLMASDSGFSQRIREVPLKTWADVEGDCPQVS